MLSGATAFYFSGYVGWQGYYVDAKLTSCEFVMVNFSCQPEWIKECLELLKIMILGCVWERVSIGDESVVWMYLVGKIHNHCKQVLFNQLVSLENTNREKANVTLYLPKLGYTLFVLSFNITTQSLLLFGLCNSYQQPLGFTGFWSLSFTGLKLLDFVLIHTKSLAYFGLAWVLTSVTEPFFSLNTLISLSIHHLSVCLAS